MDKLVYLLPVLGCVVMAAVMMVTMRGNHSGQQAPAQPDPNVQEEIAMMRAEIATLRKQQGAPQTDQAPGRGGGS